MSIKILHTVESYFPAVNGMSEVVRQISERLVRMGCDVTVATTNIGRGYQSEINGVKVFEFSISGNEVNGYQWGETKKYQDFVKNGDFDIVVNFAAQQWATDLLLPVLEEIEAKKVMVPTGFSALYDDRYKAYFESMADYMAKYDALVFLSRDYRDIHFARTHKIKNCFLIPNGAASEEFLNPSAIDIRSKLGIPRENKLITLIGSHTGVKGHKQAIEIFSRSRLKDTTLLLIGSAPEGGCANGCRKKASLLKVFPSLNLSGGKKKIIQNFLWSIFNGELFRSYFTNKQLLIAELDRDSTVAALQQSDLFFFPSNIECSPIVLFEAAAAKTPFLATDVGNSRELTEWLKCGQILPTYRVGDLCYAQIESSTQLLETLLATPEFLNSGINGHQKWKENYTWDKIAKGYFSLYRGITANSTITDIERLS